MATPNQISAVILSPCELYRRAWKSLLSSLMFVNFIQTVAATSAITLPDGSGHTIMILVDAPGSERQLAMQLSSYARRCRKFFVINEYDLHIILPLLKLGGTGFTARDDSVSNFVQAFLATARGQIGLPLDVANRAITELANSSHHDSAQSSDLTRRETEVLQLLTDGKSNRDIAQALFLSVRTVETHLRNLYGKLDVNSRTEAALWAVRHGYTSLSV